MAERERILTDQYARRIDEISKEATKHNEPDPWPAYEAAKGKLADLVGWTQPDVYEFAIARLAREMGL